MNYDRLNKRVISIKPSGIRKFFDIAAELPNAISLGVGEPDFVTPWEIRDYAIKSLQKGYTQYTSNKGLDELRKEISNYLELQFNTVYSYKDEIIVTVGASEAIDLGLRTILEYGDEVLIPDPSYVSYAPNVILSGGVPVAVPTTMENSFRLTVEEVEKAITSKTKAIIFPYPNNPTGAIMEKEDIEKLLPIIEKYDLFVLSDEIYAELTYGKKHVSIASFKGMHERTIVVNGFSKSFAMTGWRLGFVAAPKPITDQMLKIHQYTILCAPIMSQYAGLAALKTGRETDFAVVSQMREKYDRRRRLMVSEFNKMGMDCFEPLGAFYVFPCVKRFNITGQEFAERLIKEQSVAVIPGDAFGDGGKYFVRCSYAYSETGINEALSRIKTFISSL